MSFWKKAGELALKAGSAAVQETKAAKERADQYKEDMPRKRDNELVRIVQKERSHSPLKASAAFQELKARYDEDTVKRMIRGE